MKKSQFITIVIMFFIASVLIWIGAFGKDSVKNPIPSSTDSLLAGTVKPAETPAQGNATPDAENPTEDPSETQEPGASSAPETEVPTEGPTEEPSSDAPVVFPEINNEDFADVNNTFHYWSSGFKTSPSGQNVPYLNNKDVENAISVVDYIFINDVYADQREVYLTFIAHYENGVTSNILDALKSVNAKATFFVTEQYIRENPELVKRMKDEGHIIGSRGPSPENIENTVNAMTPEDFADELLKVEAAYRELFGENERMKYCRLDYFSPRMLKIAETMGYRVTFKTYTSVNDESANEAKNSGWLGGRFWERCAYDGSVPEFTVNKIVSDEIGAFLKECSENNISFKHLGQ